MRRVFLLTGILQCFLILFVSILSIFALKVLFEEQTQLKWTTNYKINKLSFKVAWEKACDVATADWLNLNTRNQPVNKDVSRGCIFPRFVGAQRQHNVSIPAFSRLAVFPGSAPTTLHPKRKHFLFKISFLRAICPPKWTLNGFSFSCLQKPIPFGNQNQLFPVKT